MSTIPSIKGSIFGRVIEDLQKHMADGEISREEVERRLEPQDVALIDQSIWPGGWYDIQSYGRILELLKDTVGGGRNEYLLERGARSAQALLDQGLYQQLEYLSRTQVSSASDPAERFRAFGQDLSLMVSLHRVIFNFGKQTAEVDPEHPDRYILNLVDAEACPEANCWTIMGFINRMAQQHDAADLWTWERPRKDLIRFRMTRPA